MHKKIAAKLIKTQSKTIAKNSKLLNKNFDDLIKQILKRRKSRLITCAVGKSGYLAAKLTASLNSINIKSTYLHPAEAAHGDLGTIGKKDLILVISKSGENQEIIDILPRLKQNQVFSITTNPKSHIAKNTKTIITSFKTEGDQLTKTGLVPLCSSISTLSITNAIIATLIKATNFKVKEFAKNHPKGQIGKRLKLKNIDLANSKMPLLKPNEKLKDALVKIINEAGGFGIVAKNKKLKGVIKKIHKKQLNSRLKDIMIKNPKSVLENELAIKSLKKMNKYNIDHLPVLDSKNKIKALISREVLNAVGI